VTAERAPNPLKLVPNAPAIDITLLQRADIKKRDWAKCHIEGDRRRPIWLPDMVRRIWR